MSEMTDAWIVSPENTANTRQLLAALESEGCATKLVHPEVAAEAPPASQPRAILMDADTALRERVLPRMRENGVQSFVVLTRSRQTHTKISAQDVVSLFVFAVDKGDDVQTTANYIRQAVDLSTKAEEAANAIDKLFKGQPRYQRYKSVTSIRMKERGSHGLALVSAH